MNEPEKVLAELDTIIEFYGEYVIEALLSLVLRKENPITEAQYISLRQSLIAGL